MPRPKSRRIQAQKDAEESEAAAKKSEHASNPRTRDESRAPKERNTEDDNKRKRPTERGTGGGRFGQSSDDRRGEQNRSDERGGGRYGQNRSDERGGRYEQSRSDERGGRYKQNRSGGQYEKNHRDERGSGQYGRGRSDERGGTGGNYVARHDSQGGPTRGGRDAPPSDELKFAIGEGSLALPDSDEVQLVCVCARGTEKAVKYEVQEIGGDAITAPAKATGRGAVLVSGKPSLIGRLNVFSRLLSKVLWVQHEFRACSEGDLVAGLSCFPFEEHLDSYSTFAIEAHLHDAAMTHSRYVAQRVKDVIVDRIRALGRTRPNVDTSRPQVRYILHWEKDRVSLSLDTSGEPLHKRGYRHPDALAPMRETLACAVLAMGHADVNRPFLDPCCGSGTLAIEQAFRALKWAPGEKRRFAFERWRFVSNDMKDGLHDARMKARDERLHELPAPIMLSDWHPSAVETATAQVQLAGLSKFITPQRVDARRVDSPGKHPVVVANLPFGDRLSDKQENKLQLEGFYRTLGDHLRTFSGARVLLFSTYDKTTRLVDLGYSTQWTLFSGPMRALLMRFELPRFDDEETMESS
ncbi:MAG: hypothetical protein GY822_27565 [Deltaproteobacteria bacterium]|nr:hypothetical protein [Deltaproteobacteria bacterium]